MSSDFKPFVQAQILQGEEFSCFKDYYASGPNGHLTVHVAMQRFRQQFLQALQEEPCKKY